MTPAAVGRPLFQADEVIDLLVGESPYVPAQLLDQLSRRIDPHLLARSSHSHRYSDVRGVLALREEIAHRYDRLHRAQVDPRTQIVVTQGATEAIWLSLFALTEPGDEVLIPDPSYLSFESVIRSLSRRPVRVRASPESGFVLRPEDIEPFIGPRTKVLLLASPDNPTGLVYSQRELAALSATLRDHGAYLIHDEVYDGFVYDGEFSSASTVDGEFENTVIVNSLSKRFGIGGWRIGWLISNPRVVEAATREHANITMMTPTILQEAVTPVINDLEVEHEISALSQRLRRSRDLLLTLLKLEVGASAPYGPPSGGFYAFVDVTEPCRQLGLAVPATQSPGEAFARHLSEHCGVMVGPGAAFGNSGKNCVRISFVATESQLSGMVNRLTDTL